MSYPAFIGAPFLNSGQLFLFFPEPVLDITVEASQSFPFFFFSLFSFFFPLEAFGRCAVLVTDL